MNTTAEFTHSNGRTYRMVQRPDARTQLHIARRVAPVVEALRARVATDDKATIEDMLGAAMEQISIMKDADLDYVIDRCLEVVSRQQGKDWAPLRRNGTDMFMDMDMNELVAIAMFVIRESGIGSFFVPEDKADSPPTAPLK